MKRICPDCRGTGNGMDLVARGCTRCAGSGSIPLQASAEQLKADLAKLQAMKAERGIVIRGIS